MRRILGVLMWLAAALVLHAQGPRMTVAGTQTILEIEEARVDVRVAGGVARTEMELVFRNDTPKMVEGEFTLPLPEGATVSSYALEVNGALREAVAVEKERASQAYESIKRRMVDPGLVEREAGNVYRTRVFPVPANGTKRLRIGYVETLKSENHRLEYRVPLAFHGELAKFRCEIAGAEAAELKLTGEAPLNFVNASGRRTSEAAKVRLQGALELRLPLPDGPQVLVEGEKQPVFLLNDVFPEMPEEARPPARSVVLFWDASESGARLDHAPLIRLLDAWFRKQVGVKVAVKLLRDGIEDAGSHEVRGGDWSAIRKILEAVDYDGATSFAGLACDAQEADLAIYCGDGQATLGARTGVLGCPLLVLQGGAGEVAPPLRESADRTGGITVSVDDGQPLDAALKAMTILPWRVTGVTGGAVLDFQVGDEALFPGGPVRICGTLRTAAGGPIEITYGVGKETRVRRPVAFPPAVRDEGVARRLWAQRKLATLEREPDRNRAEIIRHCREHGLVSGETSLIVLERFEDHLAYQIPPPEPDLKARYDSELARRKGDRGNQLLSAWKHRLAWHRTAYPGNDYVLLPRLRQIGMWKRAVEQVFQAGEWDPKAFATVAGWHDKAKALIERRDALPDEASYRAWLGEIDSLMKEGPGLAATPIEPPPAGKPLVVSVRGLVVQPGQVRAEGKLTVRESLARAGGPLWESALGRVALYRNGGKKVFNIASKRFEDFELKPGDMIVVENEPYDSGGMDPFAETPAPPPDGGNPVVSDQDLWIGDGSDAEGMGVGAGGSGDGSALPQRATATSIRLVDPSEADMPDLAGFEAGLKSGGDPLKAYLATKAGQLRPDRFHIEAARRLFAAGHDALAMRALSTLVERGRGNSSARRACAFWLMEFGKPVAAEQVLRELPPEEGGCPAEFSLAELATDPQQAVALLISAVNGNASTSGAVIALTELNALKPAEPPFPNMAENLPCDLRITVQSQFASALPDLEVIDPTGHPVRYYTSPTGGKVTRDKGLAEFAIRRAVPGTYRLKVDSPGGTTFRIALHTDWGSEHQKTVRTTRWVEGGEKEEVAELDFAFRPAAK
jgi:hypothetical protein